MSLKTRLKRLEDRAGSVAEALILVIRHDILAAPSWDVDDPLAGRGDPEVDASYVSICLQRPREESLLVYSTCPWEKDSVLPLPARLGEGVLREIRDAVAEEQETDASGASVES